MTELRSDYQHGSADAVSRISNNFLDTVGYAEHVQ
jgi:hypothetical protein